MTVSDTKQLLNEFGLTPNRALGQNFLCDSAVLDAMIASLPQGPGILEIGPGLGALTERLLGHAPRVVAVELDAAMIAVLQARFLGDPKLTLIHADFLKTDLDGVAAILEPPYAVAANLPYYVTTPICLRLLSDPRITHMTLMLQAEAAQRFFAEPGSRIYGPLTVLARCYYTVRHIMDVSPGSYYPQPEVNSAVISLARNSAPFTPELAALVTRAFSMRRKTLQNNLKPLGKGADFIRSRGLSPSARAESLAPEDFFKLL